MLIALLTVVLTSVLIMFACESFEQATDYLGRRMPPGIKGATLNAVASSLPELLTTFILLFFYRDVDGFSGGIATVAGSAVFNAVIIPCLCILVVDGVGRAAGRRQPRACALHRGEAGPPSCGMACSSSQRRFCSSCSSGTAPWRGGWAQP